MQLQQPYATSPLQGSGRGILTRLQAKPDIPLPLFFLACAVSVLVVCGSIMAVGTFGCLVAVATFVLHGKLFAIGVLLLDIVVVAVLSLVALRVLFD